MATESITFDILARDRASAQFDKIARSTSTLESRFAKFTASARNVATALVGVQVGKSVLEAADAFEMSRSRLETITQNIGGNFNALSKQVDVADGKMEKFGFTNAQTEGALASLESATKDPAKALKDLSLAADLARGRNIGLEEATGLLMKVETGHVALLARYGIASKDAAGHTLTAAQALQMLSQLYGGAAARTADTIAGKQRAVSAAMQDSAAKIGVALLPAALDLAKVLQDDVLPPLQASAQWLDRNRKVIEPLVAVVGGAVLAWKTYSFVTGLATEANLAFAGSTATVDAALAAEAAAAARTKLLGAGALLAGGAALYVGSKTHGDVSHVLNDTGTGVFAGAGVGAAVGAFGGPVGVAGGALLGAAGGLSYSLTTNTLHDFFGDPSKKGKGAQFTPEFQQQVDALGGVDKALAFYKTQNAAAAASAKNLAGQMNVVSTAAQRSVAQIEEAARKNINLSGAQDALRQAFQQAAQVAADNGRALTGNSDAALANRDAIRREVDAIFSVIDAMKAHGATSSATTQMLGYLEHALEINATKTYGDKAAVDALLKSLGLIPAQVSIAAQALASLTPGNQALLDSDTPSKGAIQQLNARVAKAKAEAATTGKKVAESFTAGYTPVVAKGADKAAKALSDAMDKAKQKMQSDLDKVRSDLDSAKSGLVQFASLTNNASRTDSLGASGPPLPLQAYKKQQAQRLEQFARLFGQLRKLGLNLDDLRDFVQAGPDAIPAMQQLLATGRGGIRSENRLEARINRAAGSVAQQEVASMDSKLLHQDLQSLPRKIAADLAKEFKGLHVITDTGKLDARYGAQITAAAT